MTQRGRWTRWTQRSAVICAALAIVTAGLGPAATSTSATATGEARRVTTDFRGAVEIFNCSGALVRWANSRPNDPAMMLTNGHCFQASDKRGATHRRFTREVVVDQPDARQVTLLDGRGEDLGVVRARRVLYSTSFKTDVGLYTLRRTYAEIRQAFHVRALTIAAGPPSAHAFVVMPSGFSRKEYRCDLNGQVFRLFNDDFHWRHSIRLARSSTCHTIRGTSGSPLVDPGTAAVVGVNNAINVAPHGTARCTFSLCEQSKDGHISVHPHRRYAQQTWWLTTCVGTHRRLDLDVPGCLLPKPPIA
jgi:Trypsin-like peptidase domain